MKLDELAAVLKLEGCPLSRKQYELAAKLEVFGYPPAQHKSKKEKVIKGKIIRY